MTTRWSRTSNSTAIGRAKRGMVRLRMASSATPLYAAIRPARTIVTGTEAEGSQSSKPKGMASAANRSRTNWRSRAVTRALVPYAAWVV